jgi:hypothetical protein
MTDLRERKTSRECAFAHVRKDSLAVVKRRVKDCSASQESRTMKEERIEQRKESLRAKQCADGVERAGGEFGGRFRSRRCLSGEQIGSALT